MKISTVFLTGSLVANVALLALLAAGAFDAAPPAGAVPTKAPAGTVAHAATVASADAWSELRSDDLQAEVQRLRDEGFPAATIRAILAAQVRARYAAQRRALTRGDVPYWKNEAPDPQTQAALRALDKRERDELKDLLGPDPDAGYTAMLRRQFPNWSSDRIDQIAAVRDRYNEQRQELYASVRGMLLPDEAAKLDAVDKAERTEIASFLTPAELEEYNLRTSNTANRLRSTLSAFDPTEQEFRALYALQSVFDDQYTYGRSQPSDDWMRARNEAQRQLNDSIKAALGPERYADYQRATDNSYRQTTQLVARLDLPPSTANQLYAMQQEFQQRRADVTRNALAAPEERTAQMAALQQEAIARVTPLLGGTAAAVDAYKQYGGAWIQRLNPPPPPPRP